MGHSATYIKNDITDHILKMKFQFQIWFNENVVWYNKRLHVTDN